MSLCIALKPNYFNLKYFYTGLFLQVARFQKFNHVNWITQLDSFVFLVVNSCYDLQCNSKFCVGFLWKWSYSYLSGEFLLTIRSAKPKEEKGLPKLWCFSVSDNKLLIRLLADRFFPPTQHYLSWWLTIFAEVFAKNTAYIHSIKEKWWKKSLNN